MTTKDKMDVSRILMKYKLDNRFPPSGIDRADEGSLCCSSSCISAPSALRKGKYSSNVSNRILESPRSVQSLRSSLDSKTGSQIDGVDENSERTYPTKPKNVKLNISPSVHRIPKEQNPVTSVKNLNNPLPSHVTLPNGVTILNSGFIHGRCSRFSVLFKKKWQEFVWVHCKPATIIFFRSIDDANKWTTTKILSRGQKKKLIKLAVDFDTMGILTPGYDKKKNASLYAKKYSMTDVNSKRSKLDGSILHQFYIEKWTSTGTNMVASFCSTNILEVKLIRKSIRKCMKKVAKPQRSKQLADDSSIGLSTTVSELTNFTGVSTTEYQVEEDRENKFQ